MLRTHPDGLPTVDVALDDVVLLGVSDAVIEKAGRLPNLLRSVDAIHLATALLLHEDIEAMMTYDDRLASAAKAHGLEVLAPS